MEPTHAMTHKCEQHNRSLEKALPTQESCTTQYILRYGLVVRISGSHPGGPGSIPGNGILFTFHHHCILAQPILFYKPTVRKKYSHAGS